MALENPANRLNELLERMRRDAERAGFETLAVAAYYQGRARILMQKGNLAGAATALLRPHPDMCKRPKK